MARERQNNFSAGEIAPPLHSRTDLPQYARGAKKITNLVPTKHGTLLNRTGTRYVAGAYDSTKKSRLFTFDFSDAQQYVVEVSGAGKLQVLDGTDGTVVGVPRYIAPGVGSSASRCYLARTQAAAEDPTGTWVDSAEQANGFYGCIASNLSGVVLATGTGTRFTRSTDYGETWTEYLHGITNLNAYDAVYFDGKFYVTGRNTATGALMVYSSVNGLDAWAAETPVATAPTVSALVRFGVTEDALLCAVVDSTTIRAYVLPKGGSWVTLATATWTTTFSMSATLTPFYHNGDWVIASNDRLVRISARLGTYVEINPGIVLVCVVTDGERIVSLGGSSYVSLDGGYSWSSAVTTTAMGSTWFATWCRDVFVGVTSNGQVATVRADLTGATIEDTIGGGGGTPTSLLRIGIVPMPGQAYSLTAPWSEDDLPKLRAFQSGNWVLFTCPGYPVQVLRRTGTGWTGGGLVWSLSNYFDAAPTRLATGLTISVTPSYDTDHPQKAWDWRVSWVDADGRESLPSAALSSAAIACYEDRPVTITWNSVTGAERYQVYRGRNGLYGWVGTVVAATGATQTFRDDGQLPILTRQPRTWLRPYNVFPPAVGCFFQDRLVFGGPMTRTSEMRLSSTGDYQNFDEMKDFATPDDAMVLTLASRRYEEIRALVPLEGTMLALTSEQEWAVTGGQAGLAFDNIQMTPVSALGSAWVAPVAVGKDIIFVQSSGNVVGIVGGGGQLSDLADHLLSGVTVLEMHYAAAPQPVIWCVLSSGRVLSVTLSKESQVLAWAEHIFLDAGGAEADVESATVVLEGTEHVLWVVVKRTVGGSTVRYVERMAPRDAATAAKACHLDCATQMTGTAITSVSVPQFANTTSVTYWAGGVKGTATVTAGAVTVPSCSDVVVGIPITSTLTTLSSPQTVTLHKQTPRVWVETDAAEWTWADATVGVKAASEGLTAYKLPVKDLVDGLVEINIDTSTNPGGRVTVTVDDPIPVEIRGLVREVVEGT